MGTSLHVNLANALGSHTYLFATLLVILLLVNIEWLRDAMSTDGTHRRVHTAIHLFQLSLAERLHRLAVLLLLFHNHSDLKMLCRKYREKSHITK